MGAGVHAGALAGFGFPVVFGFQIFGPEGPGPTLQWAGLVDAADSFRLHDGVARRGWIGAV